MTTTGGERLKAEIAKARREPRIEGVEAGYFERDTYEGQGTPVAQIAVQHEFGIGVPERPFIRPAVRAKEGEIRERIAAHVAGGSGVPDEGLAIMVGETLKSAIQKQIEDLRDPPNAPSTIARKGSDNPLIDTGHMRASTRYRIKYS